MTAQKTRRKSQSSAIDTLLLENLQAAVVGLDGGGKVISWNRASEALLGWTAKEAAGAALVDLLRPPEGTGEPLREMLGRLESSPEARLTGRFQAKDGRALVLLVQARALRGQDGALLGTAVMLSPAPAGAVPLPVGEDLGSPDELQASPEARQAKMFQLYRGLTDTTPNYVAVVDAQLRFILINPACARAFERAYGRKPQVGEYSLDLLADFPKDLQRVRGLLSEAFGGKIARSTDLLGDPNRERVVLESIFHPIRDDGGNIIAVGMLARDVTEQARLQQALADSNAHYRALATASFEGVVISEGDNIIDLNDQLAEMLGYSLEEMIGKPVLNFVAPEDRPIVLNYVDSGGAGIFEAHLLRRDGTRILVETRGRLIFDQERTVRVSTVRDITSQRSALEALRESEERYSTLFNNRHSPMLLIEPSTGRIVDANPAACQFYGWEREQMLRMKITEINQLPVETTREKIGQAQDSETSRRFSFQHRLASGEVRDVEVQSGPIRIAGQEYLFSIIVDVTERRRAENALLESERVQRKANERFRMVVEHIPDVIVLYDRDLRIQYINEATTRITGMRPAEFIGRREEEFWPSEMYEGYMPALTEALATGEIQNIETDLVLSDGTMRSLVITCVPILDDSGAVTEVMGITHDNTERIQAEEALRESERMFRAIARNIPNGGVIVVDDGLHILAMEGSQWLGVEGDPTLLLGKPAGEVVSGEVRRVVEDGFHRALDGEAVVTEIEYAGRVIFAQFVALQNGGDLPADAMALLLDITSAKAVELALRESESRFRTSVESLMDGFAILSAVREQGRIVDFRFEYMNEAGRSMSRFPVDPVGMRLLEYLPSQRESGVFDRYLRLVETGEPMEIEDVEYLNLPGGGRRMGRTFEVRAMKLSDGVVVTWRDITHRKETEAQIITYADKLERSNKELEQFAFVASHDLQEPLRKIRMFGSSLRQKLGGRLPDDAEEYLSRIQISTDRMQMMINGLLDLSRVSTRGRTFARVDLNQVVEEVLSDLEPRIHSSGGKVTVEALPELEADALQMRQLLQNLIANALKFYRQGVPPEVRIFMDSQGAPDGAVTIVVADNGIGFEEQYIERIFEPFQRLHGRSEYEGSGIGLSICRRIVERHRGSIAVRSTPEEGTVFSITLPLKQPEGGATG